MVTRRIDWLKVARLVLLSRQLDRLEIEQLTPNGKVNYQFSAMGPELAQVLLAEMLTHPHDAAGLYYRSRPFMLASGLTASEALAAGMARTGSPSQGRDVGVVFNMPARQGPTILPASGDVGAQYTPAAGWAQAIQYRTNQTKEGEWEGAIAVALGGDGFMLETLHRYLPNRVPIFGMHRGSVGFLMNAYSPDGLAERLARALPYVLHPLEMIAIDERGGRHQAVAFNEVSLLRESRQAAKLKITVDGVVRIENPRETAEAAERAMQDGRS